MRQFLLLTGLLALAVVAVAQYPTFYTVDEKDQLCSSVDNCTAVVTVCCGDATCNYTAINKDVYRDKQQEIETAGRQCGNIGCPTRGEPCEQPRISCEIQANGNGLCVIGSATPPSSDSCTVHYDRETCETSCMMKSADANPKACTSRNMTINCINSCNLQFGTCDLSAQRMCAFTYTDAKGHQECIRQCTTTPSPSTECTISQEKDTCAVTCVGSTNAPHQCTPQDDATICKNQCYLAHSQCAIGSDGTCAFGTNSELSVCLRSCDSVDPPACHVGYGDKCELTCVNEPNQQCNTTIDPLLRCQNACTSEWMTCGALTNTGPCEFTPKNESAYQECLANCNPPTPVDVKPPVDVKTPVDVKPPESDNRCFVGADDLCSSTCTSTPAESSCTPNDPTIRCKNACLTQYAKCTVGTDATATCEFVITDAAAYEQCIQKCNPTDPVDECGFTHDQHCQVTCVPGKPAQPIGDCESNDPLVDCLNDCKLELTVCKRITENVPGAMAGVCALVPTDFDIYKACIEKCRIPPPQPPPPTTCKNITAPNTCRHVCVADPGDAYTPPTCTSSPLTDCLNACDAHSKCTVTAAGCAFVPPDHQKHRECVAKCHQTPAPTTRPPQCIRTGCSGEICSTVPIMSDCSYSCEKACYRNATCAPFTADDAGNMRCAWLHTDELRDCLKNCQPAIPTPAVVSPPGCKVTGCSQELCVPTNAPDPDCRHIMEPTCETKCLAYARCTELPASSYADNTDRKHCGWIADPTNPGPYAECLQRCKQVNNPCFVSGCGTVCSTVASLRPCQTEMTCENRCHIAFSTCNLTRAGTCAFFGTADLKKCLETCSPTPVVDPPRPVCPQGVEPVECLVDPCSVTRCPAYPNAKCTADRCGTCRAIFTVDGKRVNCDSGCHARRCDDCLRQQGCAFCLGNYSLANSATFNTFGVCVPVNSDAASKCLASSARLLPSGASCPVTQDSGNDDTSTTEDPAPFQHEIAASTSSVRDRFVIVISLVVNQTTERVGRDNIVKMFIDLVGTQEPSQDDRDQVCTILKEALTKVDRRIPIHLVKCEIAERISQKRDVSYVADLSYPADALVSDTTATASAMVASFAAIAVALVALVF